jgi:hypothetical protein
MKIANKKVMLINFIKTMLSDKEDNYYVVMPELTGSVTVNIGNDKNKKYQYVNGDICIPYAMLNDEHKKDFNVVNKLPLYTYAYLKKEYVNDEFMKHINETDEDLNDFISKNPKVEKALNDLLEALKNIDY